MNATAPVDSHAITLIEELAHQAGTVQIISIPTEGLGEGLPKTVPIGFDRKDQRVISLKASIEEFRQAPQRRRGTATADTLRSFIDLVKLHKDENSVIFGKTTYPDPKLTAVINYDSADTDARHGDHRIVYAFPLTDEFKLWINQNKKTMEQEVFAAFLEEHSAELAAPSDAEVIEYQRLFGERFATPSEVIELSRHLEVFVSARAKQGIRLQSGERVLEFSEEHMNAKGEPVTIPGLFMVSVRAFIDGDAVRIPARLRYRVAGGSVSWFYQLYRWEAFLREQVEHDLFDAAKETALAHYQGAPEAKG
jgi:uncharacterized protein YfdQ (DUF2303 family)